MRSYEYISKKSIGNYLQRGEAATNFGWVRIPTLFKKVSKVSRISKSKVKMCKLWLSTTRFTHYRRKKENK